MITLFAFDVFGGFCWRAWLIYASSDIGGFSRDCCLGPTYFPLNSKLYLNLWVSPSLPRPQVPFQLVFVLHWLPEWHSAQDSRHSLSLGGDYVVTVPRWVHRNYVVIFNFVLWDKVCDWLTIRVYLSRFLFLRAAFNLFERVEYFKLQFSSFTKEGRKTQWARSFTSSLQLLLLPGLEILLSSHQWEWL